MTTKRKRIKRMRRAAAKAPLWLRTGAAAHFDPHGERRHRESKLGTFGPASEVRRIPVTPTPLPSEAAE